jgi:hypothetical protein
MKEKPRYPENAPGPFYVESDLCITCGGPAAVAPGLVELNERRCYFKKQPSNAAELAQAIGAVNNSCCGAYRYGGDDPKVIVQLDAGICDQAEDVLGKSRISQGYRRTLLFIRKHIR